MFHGLLPLQAIKFTVIRSHRNWGDCVAAVFFVTDFEELRASQSPALREDNFIRGVSNFAQTCTANESIVQVAANSVASSQ